MADWLIIPLSRLSRTLDQLFLSWRDEIHLLSRRQGEDTHAHRDFAEDGGFLCPSEVKYARPQLAQTSRGVWKYIINMGEHTQTIRMERCLYVVTVLWFYIIERTEFNIFFFCNGISRKPGGSCSYVSPHYKSHCIQVYNYHRLLSFEEGKGMHVDIYKVNISAPPSSFFFTRDSFLKLLLMKMLLLFLLDSRRMQLPRPGLCLPLSTVRWQTYRPHYTARFQDGRWHYTFQQPQDDDNNGEPSQQ